MRVLMALPDRRVRGGPPSHLYLLRDALISLGIDVRSFVYGGRTHDEGRIRKLVGRLVDLAAYPVQILWNRPDIVHLNSAFDRRGVLRDVFFVTLARLLGQRVVIKFHGSDLELVHNKSRFWRATTWLTVRGAAMVCLLSQEEEAGFRERFPRVRFAVVRNALDFDRYRRGTDFRERYRIPPAKPLLLFIARFIETKGLRETILALPEIRRHHEVHAVFVGDGPARAENEALCRERGLETCTTFTGYIREEETVDAYLAASLLVFPTYHFEGMPMVIFHSLACGLPIVTTRIRAAADWLEDGKHCVFVPPRDPAAVATAVIHLLDRPEMMKAMSRDGRLLVRRFEKGEVASSFAALYEQVMETRR